MTEPFRRLWQRVAFAVAGPTLFLPAALAAADITVNSLADTVADDGACTFREAAIAVNTDTASGALPGECAAGGAIDTIVFAVPGGTIFSSAGAIVFDQPVTILGPGADALALMNSSPWERVLVVDGLDAPLSFTLIGLTLAEGEAVAPYRARAEGQGGGLLALELQSLALEDVRFVGNDARQGGAGLLLELRPGGSALIQDSAFEANLVASGLAGGGGGMILSGDGTTTIRRTLFAGNSSFNSSGALGESHGGALWVPPLATGALEILESTFSGNRTLGNGGAIAFGSPATPGFDPTVATAIVDSTFTLNVADDNGDNASSGGGLHALHTGALVTLGNSIFAGNVDEGSTAAPDLRGETANLASAGYNLVGIRAGAGTVFAAGLPNAANDWVGTNAAPLDPLLGPLADNGGPTASHSPSLAPVSPAIDQGSCPDGFYDQRFWTNPATNRRIFDEAGVVNLADGCDIGAVEVGLGPPVELHEDGFEPGDVRFWAGVLGWATP